jgi:hypothetical protein
MTCSRRLIGWLLTLLVSLVAAPAALGATPAQQAVAPATLGATPAQQAVAAVRQFLATHGHGCPHFTVQRVRAHATTAAEVSDPRAAGYDVIVQLTRATEPAEFLVSRGQVYPDDPVSGALALGCHATPPAPATALAWHALPYLNLGTGAIETGSDGPWIGAQVNRALPTFAIQFPEGDSSPVWAATCSAHKQTVKFERTVYLLGPPDSLSFLLTAAVLGAHAPALTQVRLVINGQTVLEAAPSDGYVAGEIPASVLSSIGYGASTVQVIVVKPASGPCNGRSGQQYGVHFTITGHFHADTIASSRPVAGTLSCTATGCHGRAALAFSLTNEGPVELLEPRFDLLLTLAEPHEVSAPYFSAVQSGLTGIRCHFNRPTAREYHVYCDWSPFAPAASGTLEFKFPYRVSGASRAVPISERWSDAWSFAPPYGPGSLGASGSQTITVCRPMSANCPSAIRFS